MKENNIELPTAYRQQIHKSKYSRWNEKEFRREHWQETVDRYVNFIENRASQLGVSLYDEGVLEDIRKEFYKTDTLSSMRALMTAGPAADRDHCAIYNCSYLAINRVQAFDEAMYILMCFAPETLVRTKDGDKPISEIKDGDEVLSYDEKTNSFIYARSSASFTTGSANRNKVAIELENGQVFNCTEDHKWLTENRGWVEAKDLTTEDELVAPTHSVYRLVSPSGKSYVGITTKDVDERLAQHSYMATRDGTLPLHKALNKYSLEEWEVSVIDMAYSVEEAHNKEVAYIELYDSYNSGYNATKGGEGCVGRVYTEDQRKTLSKIKTDLWNSLSDEEKEAKINQLTSDSAREKINATRRTDEYREAARERNLAEKNPAFGKRHTPERIEQIRKQNKGENNPFYGRKHTEETKQKIRDTKARNKALAENK